MRAAFLLSVSLLALLPTGALSQVAGGDVETVVVTGARLRQTPVQDTPVAVSVLSADQIASLHTDSIVGLSSTLPNVMIASGGPTGGSVATLDIRGFSTSSNDPSNEPAVAVYVDGVYQSSNVGSLADLYDVDHVEVLRGPQGALLGKSAGAGAVLVTRSRPTGEWGLDAGIEYGSDNLIQTQARLNFPIVDGVLAGKVFASFRERDDYTTNLSFPGHNLGGISEGVGRAAFLFTPADNFKLYLSTDYIWTDNDMVSGRDIGGPTDTVCKNFGFCQPDPGRVQVTRAGFTLPSHTHGSNTVANAEWDVGWGTFTSVSGLMTQGLQNNVDFDYMPGTFLQVANQQISGVQYSEELRLASDKNGGFDLGGRLSWIVGFDYYNSSGNNVQHSITFATNPNFSNQSQHLNRESTSFFASFDYMLWEDLTASFGLRHSNDQTNHRFSLPVIGPVTTMPASNNFQTTSSDNTSFEGGLKYNFDSNKMVYLRYAQGYRAGGFTGLPASLAASAAYKPETSVNYEAGIKTQWFDNRVMFNLTLFHTDFVNLQRRVTVAQPNGTFVLLTSNAANATMQGVEVEAMYQPIDDLTFNASGGLLDPEYTRYIQQTAGGPQDVSNRPFLFAPKATGSLSADYRLNFADSPIWLFSQADFQAGVTYRSRYTQSETGDPRFFIPPLALVNLSVGLTDPESRYNVQVYMKDLLGANYIDYLSDTGGLVPFASDDIGRTAGVSLSVKF